MTLTEAIDKLRLPHDINDYEEEELHTFLSILMPGYEFKFAFDIRNIDDYAESMDALDILVTELVKLVNTNKIEDMQTDYYSSSEVDDMEENEYYIRIVAYKTK